MKNKIKGKQKILTKLKNLLKSDPSGNSATEYLVQLYKDDVVSEKQADELFDEAERLAYPPNKEDKK